MPGEYSALTLSAPGDAGTGLGVGAHLSASVALSRGAQVELCTPPGDMETPEGRDAYRHALDAMLRDAPAAPEWIAHDSHPDYFSTQVAQELSAKLGLPLISVQHHHAHLAAAALDHGLQGELTALTWDGTGDGEDGTVWGGEMLVGTAAQSVRVGSLVPFVLPGGEAAVREPWRTAWSLLHQAFEGEIPRTVRVESPAAAPVVEGVKQLLGRPGLGVRTTSMGRLFDGVSALLGLCSVNTHQALAPQRLEQAATGAAGEAWPVEWVQDGAILRLDWRPLVCRLVRRLADGGSVPVLAAGFHAWLATAALEAIDRVGRGPTLLSGGVFCNRLLTRSILERAKKSGRDVRAHSVLPPTDGALAAGQVWAAASRMSN